MAGTTDFVPFATSATANVESQSTYIAATTTQTGFQSGVASSADCNKVWRQGTFIAAGVATFVANELGINVPDDGNLTNFVTSFTDALNSLIATDLNGYATESWVTSQGYATETWVTTQGYATETWVTSQNYATTAFASNASNITTGTLPAAQLPQSFTVTGTITAGAFNATSDARLKKNVRPIDAPLERISRMHGVLFEWKKDGTRSAGVIAQDVREALDVAVRGDDILRVDPVAIIGLLVESLNAERAAREALEARVAALESAAGTDALGTDVR